MSEIGNHIPQVGFLFLSIQTQETPLHFTDYANSRASYAIKCPIQASKGCFYIQNFFYYPLRGIEYLRYPILLEAIGVQYIEILSFVSYPSVGGIT